MSELTPDQEAACHHIVELLELIQFDGFADNEPARARASQLALKIELLASSHPDDAIIQTAVSQGRVFLAGTLSETTPGTP